MTLAFRRAGADDAAVVHALLADAGRTMAAHGFHNWDPPYPLERVTADIAEREVWLVQDDGVAVATYTLAPTPVRAYEFVPWSDPDARALYLNRLAVAPALQRHGIGAACLGAIDAHAREVGARAVRCDVLEANEALCAFYERHGYVRRGARAHSGWTFACYERVLPG